ncbi:MAG: beta-N-acetylhexosaminidase [Solirubrobacteraceae bacterium]|nr:beta-N-acetylhexosaminidase [Solirubrobacteraceae bacterium]
MSLLTIVAASAIALFGADRAPTAAPAPTNLAGISLRDAVGSTIVMRFHGTALPQYVADALRTHDAAGVILFRDNCVSPAQTKGLTAAITHAGGPNTIIALDQEGGAIRILGWAQPVKDQIYVDKTRTAARLAAKGLRYEGVNVNLAPVADTSGPGTLMRTRAFAGDTALVAQRVRHAIEGYRNTGVAPTLKHFPGLGAATGNTDQSSVTINTSARDIGYSALPPFKAGIDAGAPAVMLSHALYPALDPDRIASESKPIVTDLLRNRLGFQGVAMTDSLEAYAVRARSSIETAAIRSMRAGVDIILTTGAGSHIRILRAFTALARSDRGFLDRLRRATVRVRTLRQSLGDG